MTAITDAYRDARDYIETNPNALESRLLAALLSDCQAARQSKREAQEACASWERAAEVWKGVNLKLSTLQQKWDALVVAARVTSHGDHDYDPDAPPRTDCFLCAAIESRFRPQWMEEPYIWLCDPVVIDKGGSPKRDRRYDLDDPAPSAPPPAGRYYESPVGDPPMCPGCGNHIDGVCRRERCAYGKPEETL